MQKLLADKRLGHGNNLFTLICKHFCGPFRRKFKYPCIETFSLIYLRFKDNIFFIWTRSKTDLEKLLNKLNGKHLSIKIEYEILNLEYWIFESPFFRRKIFIFFLIFGISSKFYFSKKIIKLLFYCIFIDSFCVRTKFNFLCKSSKASLQNLLVFRLITCPAGSDLILIVSLSVFRNLTKLSWFVPLRL